MSAKATDKLPMLSVRASLVPKTFNKEARTIECVLTSTLPVERASWTRGRYNEILSMEAKHIRLERANSGGMPLLNNHGTAFFGGIKDLSDVIGVIDKVWLEDEEMKGLLRFADTSDVETIFRKVETGILKNISIGYRVFKYEDITPRNSKGELQVPSVLKAIDWEIFEGSVVAIPADYTAMMKSERAQDKIELNEVEIVQRAIQENIAPSVQKNLEEKSHMENGKENPATPAAPVVDQKAIEAAKEAGIKEGIEKANKRQSQIREAGKKLKIKDEDIEKLVKSDKTADEARIEMIDLAAKAEPVITNQNPSVTVTRDARDTFRKAAMEAVLFRADPHRHKMTDLSRNFVGFSLMELARKSLELEGVKTEGMGKMELVTRAMQTTGDLPYLLADAMNKQLRAAYGESPRTFTAWAKKGSAPDFKSIKRIQAGNFPSLTKVNEHGEFKQYAVKEGKEEYSLATYGAIIAFTRQMIINDDLDALSRVASGAGLASAALESDIVYGILTANAALSDSFALFEAATHKNYTSSGTVINVANLGIGKAAMRVQKTLENRPMNLVPKFLIVPASLETVAQQYVRETLVPDSPSNTNPFQNQMQLVIEPRLDANSLVSWYLACNPGLCDTIEYSYLDGNEGVFTETKMGFEVDGVAIKARHDFAAKAIDYRGLYKNAGA